MNMTNEEYGELVRQRAPKSAFGGDLVKAFVVGGLICCAGQALSAVYGRLAGLDEEASAAAVSVTLIFLSVLLTGLNVYDRLARFAGAGTLVPITGFANAMSSPAMEYRAEGLVLGTAVKMFTIVGPVIVYGLAASMLYGVLLCLFG